MLPAVQRALPEARLPFLAPRAIAAMLGTTIAVRSLRSSGLSPTLQEIAVALLAIVPATATLRGSELAAYHGAEHISIGSYEHGELRPREHERCGSHLLGPLLVTTAAGNALVSRMAGSSRNRSLARLGVGVGSLALATEIFAWTLRHPDNPVSRALAWPGRELQTRSSPPSRRPSSSRSRRLRSANVSSSSCAMPRPRREPPPTIGRIDRVDTRAIHHVAMAVSSLDEAVETYRRLFGAEVEHRGRLGDQGIEAAYLRLGEAASSSSPHSTTTPPSGASSPAAARACTTSPTRSEASRTPSRP